jgi:outer membrane protein OmpA-like peptidoglycan-associated protein
MVKSYKILGTATLFAVTAFGTAFSQSTTSQTTSAQTPSAQTTSDPTYATGKPLETQSHEGFWGHMNPLARKKWVHRQVDPLKDRVNELDELQAKNANDIRDVDSRATAGISKAMTAAQAADAKAADASSRADQANSLAVTADAHTTALNGTVSNLDQYQAVTSEAVPFSSGRTTLGPKAKANLDDLASKLASEKGYIVEVQGYSRGGVPQSQAMADSVVRYLVTEHQVPIYRIYRTGFGRMTKDQIAAQTASNDGTKPVTNGVRVTLLHNSLATMSSSTSTTSSTSKPVSSTMTASATTAGTLNQ